MISVIVPVRNAMPFLPEALDSILGQEWGMPGVGRQSSTQLEVLVVDGGSSDGSREAALAFAQVGIIPQQGRGLAAARNEGLAAAQGDFIAFLDADDLWPAGSLAARVGYLAQHPDCPGVIGRVQRFLHGGVGAQTPLPPGYDPGWLERPSPGYTPGALLVRRDVMADIGGFDEGLSIGCDSDWFARAQDAGLGPALLPDVVLHKRIHAANLSGYVSQYRRELLMVARRSLQRRGHI